LAEHPADVDLLRPRIYSRSLYSGAQLTAKARMKKGAVVSIGIPGNPTLLLN